jgi:hypothetical protein
MTSGCRFSLHGAVPLSTAAMEGSPQLVAGMSTGGTLTLQLSAYVLRRSPFFVVIAM